MLLALCEGLKTLSCRPVVGMIRNSQKPNLETVKQARCLGIEVEVFECRGRLDWSTSRRISNWLQGQKVELIHTHGYKSDIYGATAARDFDIPMVATCHGLPKGQLGSLGLGHLYGILDRLFLRGFERVVAVSDELADSLQKRGIRKKRITVIPNGVPVARFAEALPTLGREIGKANRIVVGMVGRLIAEKGPDLFLKAAQAILVRFPDTLFALIGNGQERRNLEELTRELKIEGNVIFTGERRDMPEIYASLDIVVLPSLSEGMPMAILEAMAAGKPVVASCVGAIPGVVLPNRTGLLVEPGDVVGLHRAITTLVAAPELRVRLGEEGQRLIRRHYSAEAMAQGYMEIYHQVVGRRVAA